MLYVSRFLGPNRFGVVDTDDDSEEVVSGALILRALNSDIEIHGVEASYGPRGSNGEVGIIGAKVYPFQLEFTTLQVKTSMLLNVNVVVYKNEIASIWCSLDDTLEPVTVRLSDFGSSCAYNILDRTSFGRRHITLVIDDGVSIKRDSLIIRPGQFNVNLDIREVTNLDTLDTIYFYMRSKFSVPDAMRILIDIPGRFQDYVWNRGRI